MTAKELRQALSNIGDDVDVRIHVTVEGDITGHCLAITSAELEDFDKDLEQEFIIETANIQLPIRYRSDDVSKGKEV